VRGEINNISKKEGFFLILIARARRGTTQYKGTLSFGSPSPPHQFSEPAIPATQISSVFVPSLPWSDRYSESSSIHRFLLPVSPNLFLSLSGFISADFQAQERWTQQARPWTRQVHPLLQLRQMLPQGISLNFSFLNL
jgi:hypothetical protein